MFNVSDIRKQLISKRLDNDYVIDKSGVKMVEIIGATFKVDEDSIIGTVNKDYASREIEWYASQSLNVNDIPGGPPAIWKQVASPEGLINSNYGYLIWSEENHTQFANVLNELKANPYSRRAQMIYTRPSIWKEYNKDGMSDFICTDAVQYFIRDEKLIAHVRMRSNDAVFGFKNDKHWQRHVQILLADCLDVTIGDLIWTAGSLHVYSRHFHLIDELIQDKYLINS